MLITKIDDNTECVFQQWDTQWHRKEKANERISHLRPNITHLLFSLDSVQWFILHSYSGGLWICVEVANTSWEIHSTGNFLIVTSMHRSYSMYGEMCTIHLQCTAGPRCKQSTTKCQSDAPQHKEHRWPYLPCIAQWSVCYETITDTHEIAYVKV